MTKEEAINVIKEHIDTYITCHGEEDTVAVSLDNVDVEAFDMAIKALSSSEESEELAKAFTIGMAMGFGKNYDEMDKIMEAIKALAPKPKIGHWILTGVEGNRVWHCRCSECDKDPQDYIDGSEDWWLIKNNLPKVCPTCGAKMQEMKR